MRSKWLWVLGILVAMSGCGGGGSYGYSAAKSASPASYEPGGYAGAAAPAADARGYGGSSSAPRTASAEPMGNGGGAPLGQESQPRDVERPGLGTGWGETRESRVHEVAFLRDSNQPFAVATLHYNNLAGVRALAAFHADQVGHWTEVPAGGGAITVSIRDENGDALNALKVNDRTYVIGRDGQRYTITVTNHTNHRFETVASVDGLDVINGQPAAMDNRGYLLMPFATLQIDGFRRSQDAVAAFRFSHTSESYAAQTSGDRNVGVIGVAFFAERGDSFTPWTDGELRERDTASPFPNDPRFAQPPR